MNAAIDIGNTKTKLGLFEEDALVSVNIFDSLSDLNDFLGDVSIERSIIASVATPYSEISDTLTAIQSPLTLDISTPLPFSNNYKSKSLGLDRIAAVAGAQALYPNENVLVIDLGTCITYEVLEKGQSYHGGAISPGLHMRLKSLHNFTARLPLLTPENVDNLISNTTEGAMLSGVVHGITAEIEAYIQGVKEKYLPLIVIITGGDTKFFESKIKATIFAIPELVLVGLNAISQHNASV